MAKKVKPIGEDENPSNAQHQNDHVDNGNHYGFENSNHYGYASDAPAIDYADEKLGVNMESYIQSAINNGATVLYGTSEVDYPVINTENTIVFGLEGADIIFSLASKTIVNGGAGRDVIFGDIFDDVINGGDDEDIILGGEGSDILNGDAAQDQIYAGSGNDVVNGGAGNDLLYNIGTGDNFNTPGNDILIGGEGNDSFVFYQQTLESGNVAKILDFKTGTDKLLLIYFDSVDYTINFADSLVQGAGAKPLDANDFLVFDSKSGALSYDIDGNGAAESVQIATLTGVTAISASDFSYSF